MKHEPSRDDRPSMLRDALRVGLGLAVITAAGFLAWHVGGGRLDEGGGRDGAVDEAQSEAPRFVGSQACQPCHAEIANAWQDSQHARAMAAAEPSSVLGDFEDATLTRDDVTTRFFRREGGYFVHTQGADGRPADFRAAYTFGVEPLQQLLIDWPDGRLQAFGLAWDTRPEVEGGQRWFPLYPERELGPGDPLHWTGIDQNWNYQCSDCHATNVRKGYDETDRSFATSWSELGVGCEACHGPASNHLAWAAGAAGGDPHEGKGFTTALRASAGARWILDPGASTARRIGPRDAHELEICARCHARREQFSDAFVAGQPLRDAFRPALIVPGLYHADGQQRDEVFSWGSFVQSRMFAEGVRCTDCHQPHSGRLRAEGNAVCGGCHAPSRFDGPDHTHHPVGSAGARCAACHMPSTTYMVNDPRPDHGFRIPRPDRTLSLGTPNACDACHAERGAAWAARAIAGWFPEPRPGFQGFAEAFAAAEAREPGSRARLVGIARDGTQAPIVRASALARLAERPTAAAVEAAREALRDPDADVRMAAVSVVAEADEATRLGLLPDLLRDPSRVVRMDAARALAGSAEAGLPPSSRADFDRALAEYVAAQRFNADRPEAQSNLGGLALARARATEARQAFERALELDPSFVAAAVNLADVRRAVGDEQRVESTLRSALGLAPENAALHHALGLALVRQQRMSEALEALGAAVRFEPANARFAFVHAVALHDTGDPKRAIEVLTEAHRSNRDDPEILHLLAAYEEEAGLSEQASEHARLLGELQQSE